MELAFGTTCHGAGRPVRLQGRRPGRRRGRAGRTVPSRREADAARGDQGLTVLVSASWEESNKRSRLALATRRLLLLLRFHVWSSAKPVARSRTGRKERAARSSSFRLASATHGYVDTARASLAAAVCRRRRRVSKSGRRVTLSGCSVLPSSAAERWRHLQVHARASTRPRWASQPMDCRPRPKRWPCCPWRSAGCCPNTNSPRSPSHYRPPRTEVLDLAAKDCGPRRAMPDTARTPRLGRPCA
jgi:hypothetical protein